MPRAPTSPVLNVTPDRLDLRDRPYLPAVALAPPARLAPAKAQPVLQQGDTSACTGFALATVVNHLLARSGRAGDADVSPWMLYSMARRYDEFPGARDTGSSLRGALKGWFKHGACARALWATLEMPPPPKSPEQDWWLDAVRRPLGAYYRVDMRSITDMHVALHEVGVLMASAITHDGWFEPVADPAGAVIPARPRTARDGGHAFAIVGYDARGFLVQNSWGKGWGDDGFATLTYEDWLDNAMDCWVAQLGVVTEVRQRIAATGLAIGPRGAPLSGDRVLQNHQLAPYVIDMEHDGCLSQSGLFRTGRADVKALVNETLDAACRDWKLARGAAVDIAIYVHGGLIGEADAAQTFVRWMPALMAARRFPIFLMWESDLASTMANRLADLVRAAPLPAGGPLESLQRWWNERLEGLLAPAGTQLWREMKENAAAMSAHADAGARILFDALRESPVAKRHPPRLHLVGHSAGAIALAHLVERMTADDWRFEQLVLMAPAITVADFEALVVPALKSKRVARLRELHLTDRAEQQDPTCRPLLGYGRSLLYLVSRAFEGGGETPILGMERHFPAALAKLRNVEVTLAPSPASESTTHGGFDDDPATLRTVIASLA